MPAKCHRVDLAGESLVVFCVGGIYRVVNSRRNLSDETLLLLLRMRTRVFFSKLTPNNAWGLGDTGKIYYPEISSKYHSKTTILLRCMEIEVWYWT